MLVASIFSEMVCNPYLPHLVDANLIGSHQKHENKDKRHANQEGLNEQLSALAKARSVFKYHLRSPFTIMRDSSVNENERQLILMICVEVLY